jgi:hypothetical protein
MEFFLERVVPGVQGTVTDKVGANELISALNVPSEIKAICCSFLRSSTGPVWDEYIFKAIDAIGKCQNLEKLTIVGGLEPDYIPNHNDWALRGFLYFLDSIAISLGSMLAKNSTLEHLDLRDFPMSPDAIEALLRPLTGAPGQLPVNTSLKHISVSIVAPTVAEVVAAMLTSNKTLTHLNLAGYVFSEPSDVCMVLQSFRTNETLQTLDLVGCRSHFEWDEDVFAEMLHLTQASLCLKSIELSVAQFGEGHIEAVKAQLAANAIKRSRTNVENLREKAFHNPMKLEFSVENEVPQEILECRSSDSFEIGLDNLEVSACESKSMTRFLDFEIAIEMNQLRL